MTRARWQPTARAAWIAVNTAAVAIMLGSWLGWQTAGDLPTDSEVRAIAEVVLPSRPLGVVERTEHLSGPLYGFEEDYSLIGGSEEWNAGYVSAELPLTTIDPVVDRLTAAGWEVGEAGGGQVTAARGDWVMRVTAAGHGEQVGVWVERGQPVLAMILAVLFGAGGAVLGWWLSFRVRIGLGIRGAAGFGMLTLNSLFVLWALGYDVGALVLPVLPVLPWEAFAAVAIRPMTLFGLLAVASWLGKAAWASYGATPQPAVPGQV
ncbi:hypothetical protein [Actinoplanes palleronii]|uniref:ABC transporter permease n=1 Tax=Actinoplanes palleronii TaxID=113570 RepID=A0ABQ4B0I7_9ACTN|nr:hypothetical protein [Actinoplanes palleronii]GIE64176.1 hypothetical protein Apa02nite_002840 [Actinoplanes palleronii]